MTADAFQCLEAKYREKIPDGKESLAHPQARMDFRNFSVSLNDCRHAREISRLPPWNLE